MEYCGGGSLRDKIKKKIILDQYEVISWAKELCNALHVVHEKGIVHHDLKPDNILFSGEEKIKIADFGVANTRGGTISYMAPELLMASGSVSRKDGRVDIYALGVTILEALSGINPFYIMSEEDALLKKINLDFIPQSIHSWLKEVLLKALNPKPELRFQSMLEFFEALESRHVPYVFNQKRIQAHNTALKAEWHLNRRNWSRTLKLTEQSLFLDPSCLKALLTAGQCELFMKRIDKASYYFEKAIHLNPRVNIQKELGWIYIERGRYAEAISMLNDHLQRNAADYEAYNLLIKIFYLTERYEEAAELINIILKEYQANMCFENNLFICRLLLGVQGNKLFRNMGINPFIRYNWTVFAETPASWDENGRISLKSKLLFQEFRFGNIKKWKNNVLVIENEKGKQWRFKQPIVSLGRSEPNDFITSRETVSRRHCVIVNHADDVWLYNLGSTHGTFLDGNPVESAAFLEGRHKLKISDTQLTVFSKEGILL
jgi:tetratricopeptide (TPR) repeat protein